MFLVFKINPFKFWQMGYDVFLYNKMLIWINLVVRNIRLKCPKWVSNKFARLTFLDLKVFTQKTQRRAPASNSVGRLFLKDQHHLFSLDLDRPIVTKKSSSTLLSQHQSDLPILDIRDTKTTSIAFGSWGVSLEPE